MLRRLFLSSGAACAAASASAAPPAEMIPLPRLGRIAPRRSRDIASSPWGIQAGSLDESILERAAEIGVKWTRLVASWSQIETARASYDWSRTDQAFRAVLRHGITPFVTLTGGNSLYTQWSTYDDPKLAEIYGRTLGPPTGSPEAMQAWLAFVRAAVERYRDLIAHWEIWNEPNMRAYWGAEPSAADYGRLVRETAGVIRQIAPQARILAGSTAGLVPDFIDGFLSGGAARLIDVVTFHNYAAVPEERIYRGIEVKELLKRHDPRLELWQGECGYPSHSSTRDYRGRAPWGLNIQAKWLLRQGLTDTYFLGAGVSNYFLLAHSGKRGETPRRSFLSPIDRVLGFPERGGSRVRTVGVNEKCLLTNPDLRPKPGFFAYRNLCALIDGRFAPAEVEYRIDVRDAGPFYGIGPEDDAFPSVPLLASYRSPAGPILAYWLPWYPSEYLPQLARIDLRAAAVFKEPVLVDLLNGGVHRLQPPRNGVFQSLPLADYPLAIAEKPQVGIVPA